MGKVWSFMSKRIKVLIALILLVIAPLASVTTATSETEEIQAFQVKAALVTNFLKYIQWPESYSVELGNELLFGIVGKDPFGEFLDRRLSRITVDGKSVKIVRFGGLDDITKTHVLYITASEEAIYKAVLKKVNGTSAVTVSEVDDFIESGGMINFTIDKDTSKVRFQLNLKAAREQHIQIYPRIVGLAEKVIK